MPPGAPPALRSCLSVPLQARARTIGTLRMGVGPSGRRFGPRDLRFAEVLADRVALALENAGLSAELEDAERRFRAIVDGMLDGVTVRAADGRLVYANDAAIDLLRIDSRDDLRERAARRDDGACSRPTTSTGRPVQLDQLPGVRAWNLDHDPEPMIVRNVVRATGEQRWLLSKAIAIRDSDGAPAYVVNFTEDVTAVKRGGARAARARRGRPRAGLLARLRRDAAAGGAARRARPRGLVRRRHAGPRGLIEPVAIGHVDPGKVAIAPRAARALPGAHGRARGPRRRSCAATRPTSSSTRRPTRRSSRSPPTSGTSSSCAASASTRSWSCRSSAPRVVGTLTFVSALPRRFDDDDLALALELGRRAGVAVENARLYSERADIAHTLQIALVPDPVPLAPGWDVAALYRPAGEATEAGGDFYDMVRTDDGWLVVMGDVAGKGARAASLTALARYTLRTAAMLTGDPAAALAALNSGLMRRQDVAYCTAALVALEEDGDGGGARAASSAPGIRCRCCSRAAARASSAARARCSGRWSGADWPGEEVVLGAGDRLVLYTDGVTDARGDQDRFGDHRLLELLSGVDGAAPASSCTRSTARSGGSRPARSATTRRCWRSAASSRASSRWRAARRR